MVTGTVNVVPINESALYGESSGFSNELFIIAPPSYTIAGSTGWIVDALGVPGHIVGGGGENQERIETKNLKSVQVRFTKDNYWSDNGIGHENLVSIKFIDKDGKSKTIGNTAIKLPYSNILNDQTYTYDIPNGQVFIGLQIHYQRYVHGIKILTTHWPEK